MGYLESILKKQFKKQINKGFKQNTKSQRANSQDATHILREIREKQKLADDIKKNAKFESTGLLKIVQDCVELVNTTANPEVFFMRYNLMLENLEKLAGLERAGIFDNSPELPSEAFLRVEAQFDAATNDFLDRSFEKAKAHANTLKTDSGKTNAIKRYFDNIEKYIPQMSGNSLEHFSKMKETYLKD